ncbi:MAG TPA: secretin N-terminal domain-containing protein [Burkholderiales bacterium]|nr:secretin N-terminal domain-containing protein [Burkholderiales bacterium]
MGPKTVPLHAVAGARALSARAAAAFAWSLALAVAGCANIKPYIPPSDGHITRPVAKPEADKAIPPPTRVSDLVPPPKPAVKPQTYSVVVSEVPVKDLLVALARDTKQNIDVHPGISGLVSLNAVNETLPAILERVSKQSNMRYRLEGNTIVVSPDTPYVKSYRVNYVNMARESQSTIGVSGELTVVGGASGGAAGGAGAGTSGSSTVVRTVSRNDFWDQLRDNIRSILNSTRLQSLTAEAKGERLALIKQEQEMRVKQMEAASRAGQGAPSLAASVVSSSGGAQQQASLLPDDVVVNPISGTVTVNATEKQHQLVQQHIDSIISAVQRQVLIEATIVEVLLSEKYQGGVDWSRFPVSPGSGPTLQQNLTNPGFGTGLSAGSSNFFQFGYVNPTSRIGNISAMVTLLQEFGNTRVLSSPKLMALNNQTALLKVVDNVVYFEVSSSTTQSQTTALQSFSTTAKTVAVGLVMSVTPQVNEDGRVSLTVRPTVTRLNPDAPFVPDPNPALANPCGPVPAGTCTIPAIVNNVPQVQVREMESVLQVGSGQTVVLGGLMQDGTQRARKQIPGADELSAAGELLRFRAESVVKSELIVFLRPIVVANPSLESDELKFFQRFLPKPEPAPAKTSAAPQ